MEKTAEQLPKVELHRSTVGEDEIDSLGHMNVRFYVARMVAANRELLERAGLLDSESTGGAMSTERRIRRLDTYTRFLKEQFTGAELVTTGGFFGPNEVAELDALDGVGCYFEIRNATNGDLAAVFIVRNELVDDAGGQVLANPDRDQLFASSLGAAIPAKSRPRSLSFALPTAVSLAELSALASPDPVVGMMSGRREGVVLPEDGDEQGRLKDDVDVMFLIARAQFNAGDTARGPPVQKDAQGRRFSWAMMETRSLQYRRPLVGDKVVSIGADIGFSDKWRLARRWTFVQGSGELLGVADSLGICIDLDARKAIAIPSELRDAIAQNALPQFA